MAKTIVVGVTGGIAAYKAAALCSLLVKSGHQVHVLMTPGATRFIQPLTFQALTKHPVITEPFDEPDSSEIAHIALADKADLFLIAPATANIIGKLAHGIADDMVSTTALAVTAPVVVAPAMNVHMYAHPAVQDNLQVLRARGVIVMDPGSGPLACGYTGKGRMPEPEDIAQVVDAVLHRTTRLAGVRMVVTAGPTVEDIDPVRYLSNASTGKMGYAIARAAVEEGAQVTLVSGPTHLPPVAGATMVHVRSTQDMLDTVHAAMQDATVLISAAAPADFRPAERLPYKWKKSMGTPSMVLEPTPDVLASVGASKRDGQVLIGFAAETTDGLESARSKLVKKNLDLVVLNDVGQPDAGFAVDTNRVTLVGPNGAMDPLPLMNKSEVAMRLMDRVAAMLGKTSPKQE